MAESIDGSRELLKRFAALRTGKANAAILSDWSLLTERYAKEEAHSFRKTGNLQRSIRLGEINVKAGFARVVAGGTKLVANSRRPGQMIQSGYAAHVEFGTRAHDIKPRRKKVLFFPSQYALNANRAKLRGTGIVPSGSLSFRKSGNLREGSVARFGTLGFQYAKVVHHPGTKPQPYLRPGASRALRETGLAEKTIRIWNEAA